MRSGCLGFCLWMASCASPPVDAAAIQIAEAAPAGWRAEDTVVVTGRRWSWQTQWAEQSDAQLMLPTDRPVKLELRAMDTAHRLLFPELGLDLRAAPEQPAAVWVTMLRSGDWSSRCVQECPEHQSAFTLQLRALSPDDHAGWRTRDERPPAGMSAAAWGAGLYRRFGCGSCHRLDEASHGPPLRRFWGAEATASDGRKVLVDGDAGAELLRQSMLAPNSFLLQGYAPTMPSYKGQLNDAQLDAIVALLRCLPTPEAPACKDAAL